MSGGFRVAQATVRSWNISVIDNFPTPMNREKSRFRPTCTQTRLGRAKAKSAVPTPHVSYLDLETGKGRYDGTFAPVPINLGYRPLTP